VLLGFTPVTFIVWYRWDSGRNHGLNFGYYGEFNRVLVNAAREGVKAGKGGQQVAAELVLPEKLKGYSLTGFRGGVDANLAAIMDELKAAK
jgi:hypothetical protein